MRLTHVGHSCVLVEIGGQRILIDPGTLTDDWEMFTGLDAVLITHTHPDHCDRGRLPALLDRNPDALVAAESHLAHELDAAGLSVEPLTSGESLDVGPVSVVAVGGQHAVVHPDIPAVGNVGLLLQAAEEPALLHPGDSYEATPRGVDVLAVPLHAPWAALKETVEFVRSVAPRIAFPVHDGLLNDRGRELYLRQLTALCRAEVRDLADADARGVAFGTMAAAESSQAP